MPNPSVYLTESLGIIFGNFGGGITEPKLFRNEFGNIFVRNGTGVCGSSGPKSPKSLPGRPARSVKSQEPTKDPEVKGSRSCQSLVTPLFWGTKAPKTLLYRVSEQASLETSAEDDSFETCSDLFKTFFESLCRHAWEDF